MTHTKSYNNVLIDGDIIINKACFTCEKVWYDVHTDNDVYLDSFSSKHDAEEFCKQVDEKTTLVKNRISQPVGLVYKIMDNLVHSILKELDCSEYAIIVGPPSGTKTFRHNLAHTAVYKGNRKESDKPIYFHEAKQYLITNGAIVSEKYETDDWLGIMQTLDQSSIIASIDKDLMQIPGWHYDINKHDKTFVTEPGYVSIVDTGAQKKLVGYGFKFFCAQLLLGDRVDNIIGIKGYGPIKTFKLLSEIEQVSDMWSCIQGVYNEHNRDLDENARLLWILREEGKTYKDFLSENTIGI